ncbi:MAG: Glycosyltransferase [Candidatus Levybacteria bacterium GW2011_GWB1_39_7]|nr:MAG: Glycosyltransferase [Candidatus Levybacteria bacterium GW2011_GWB1_39_7]OGH45388.1 MAG: hypothetical protein A3H82_01460 [Candidatus Levybacteria bacterium RIFCSPLOWO2_02_FULL_39_26]
MKIAIVTSNNLPLNAATRKGTEIIVYDLISYLVKNQQLQITAFASGDSDLPVKIESVDNKSTFANEGVLSEDKHIIFELALLSKAFTKQNEFDLFHVNIGDGDIALPFSPFVKKPILITIHHALDTDYIRKYFSIFKNAQNVFFISASNAQRKLLPDLNYLTTIYHGVDPEIFSFNGEGGERIMWAGRAIPEKGVDIVVEVARKMKHEARLFGIPRKEHKAWLQKTVLDKIKNSSLSVPISIEMDQKREQLIKHFQTSRLFLSPVTYEESFGLVLIESMSCGTPVVAYARGSIPEVVVDGTTGFIVNESENDIRGNWIVKKTGVDGLMEAVERIYAMPQDKYLALRKACSNHIGENFTIEKMAENYIHAYKKVIA